MLRVCVLLFYFISYSVNSINSYVSYAEFSNGQEKIKLVVDLERESESFTNENHIVYKSVKFEFNSEFYFIGNVINKKLKTARWGLFRDWSQFYSSIFDRGLGFYTKINNDHFVVLNDGKEAKGYPTFTKFYLLKVVNNKTEFKLVHEMKGVAISDLVQKNNNYFVSGYKEDGFYAAEVTFDNKSLLFEPLEMVRYLGSDL